MPWNPRVTVGKPSALLDPFRDRVALLHRNRERVGQVLITTQWYVEQTGGHLWWRHWADPVEVPHAWLSFEDGDRHDFVVPVHDLEHEVDDWRAGRFLYGKEVFHATWLSEAASSTIGREQFTP